MNYIWGIMILTGVVYGTVTGNVEAVSDAVLSSAKEAVTLCITMLGVMGLWMGLMEIARDAGLIDVISRKIQPLIHFLFPGIPADHPANEHITMNCVANFLGLGWAATPAGLRAMEELAKLEEERREQAGADVQGAGREISQNKWEISQPGDDSERVRKHPAAQDARKGQKAKKKRWPGDGRVMPRGVASNEMCTFLILNISSLQLIPVNVIAYRSQYGSVNPTAVVVPGILATAVSTGVAIVYCKVMDNRKRRL